MRIGRYLLFEEIASGGMASVHLGRALGDEGFSRTVAIKRLHPHVAAAPDAAEMFMDEARLTARIQHRNVVATLDVVRVERDLLLVMEYVHGVSLAELAATAKERGERIPLPIVSALMCDLLTALDAVHRIADDHGASLRVVHRDVSPQNVLVGADGTARLIDFGVAMAEGRLQDPTTQDGLKGKLFYLSPEQIRSEPIDGRSDQFAAGAVMWGLLTGKRLFDAASEGAVLAKVLEGVIVPPSRLDAEVPSAIDAIVLRALARSAAERFATCAEMADAVRQALAPASPMEVGQWVMGLGGETLRSREQRIAAMESASRFAAAPTPTTNDERRPRRRRIALVGALLAVAVAGSVTAAATASRREAPPANASAAPPASIAATATAVASAPAASESAPVASAPATAAAKPPVARPPTKRGARPSSTPPSCAQLYTVDGDGIRRVKPECL